jgi:hypothetical protein
MKAHTHALKFTKINKKAKLLNKDGGDIISCILN